MRSQVGCAPDFIAFGRPASLRNRPTEKILWLERSENELRFSAKGIETYVLKFKPELTADATLQVTLHPLMFQGCCFTQAQFSTRTVARSSQTTTPRPFGSPTRGGATNKSRPTWRTIPQRS
jgi:hypothetical protein